MTVQQLFRRVLVLFFVLSLPASVLLAASESYIQTLTGKIKQGDSCVVIDDKFLHLSLDEWNKIQHLSVDNIISFELRFDTSVYFYNKPFTCTLNVSVKYFTSRDQTVPDEINNVNLVVKYDTAKGAFYPADAHYKFKNAFKVVVVVNSITSREWGNDIPAIFRLKNQILVERKYLFDAQAGGVLMGTSQSNEPATGKLMFRSLMADCGTTQSLSNEQLISWTPADFGNAEEYDVEWTFIDAMSENGITIASSYGNGASLPVDKAKEWMLNNCSRVTVTGSTYTVNLPYPDGYLLVRVRGVSYQANTNLRLLGPWKYLIPNGYAFCQPVAAHESGLNWQYTAAFAEEGKRKEVITYFDGTLRNRQAVAINNSDQTQVPGSTDPTDVEPTATVQETVYDQMGRPAVNVMPAPTNSKSLNYYQAFNTNSNNAAFDHTDIPLGTNCSAVGGQMSNCSGASQYYSAKNPFLGDNNFYFTKHVADAQLYPYSLTEYMPDNTGRLLRQGGVGKIFQPNYTDDNGNTVPGKTTQYFYAKPAQKELDRLFGLEVGDCSHYLKNMVIDPNGQASVSYIDANGKTIATGLSGQAPGTVDALPSAAEASKSYNQQLIGPADFRKDAGELLLKSTATFLADDIGAFVIHYSVNPAALTTTHHNGQFCSDCYYDVLVEVRDDCGNIINSTTSKPFTINDVTCNPNAAPVTGDLNLQITKKGSYNVIYLLRLSQDVINYQTAYYITNNSDLKTLLKFFDDEMKELDLSGCYSTCEACKTLGSSAEFSQKVMDLLMTDKFKAVLADPDFSTYFPIWINSIYPGLKAKCDNISCNTVTSACEDYLAQMKEDVKPGGQYARYIYDEATDTYSFHPDDRAVNVMRFYNINDPDNTEIYNFSYNRDDGTTVYLHDLSESDFIRAYLDHQEWADMFVKKHIEYCGYLFCKDQSFTPVDKSNEASYNFDKALREKVSSGSDAESRGYYNRSNMYALLDADPFFNGGRGSNYKSSMVSDLNDLSTAIGFVLKDGNGTALSGKNIFDFIDWILYCKPTTATNDLNVFLNSWTSCALNTACRSTGYEWELYKDYYLQLKSKYLYRVKTEVSPDCKDCFIGKDAILAADSTLLPCASNTTTPDAGPCPVMSDFSMERERMQPETIYTAGNNNQQLNPPIILGDGSVFVIDEFLLPFSSEWSMFSVEKVYYIHNGGAVTRPVNIQVKVRRDGNGGGNWIQERYYWITLQPGQDRVVLGYEENAYSSGTHSLIWVDISVQDVQCPPYYIEPPTFCPGDPLAAAYAGKTRIFNDHVNQDTYLKCLNANAPASLPTDAENLDKFRAQALSDLNDLKTSWTQQLRAVKDGESPKFDGISYNDIDNLVNALVEVAKTNIQRASTPDAVRAASNYPDNINNPPPGVYQDFKAAFKAIVGATNYQQGFGPELLERPYPYDKTPVDINSNSGEVNSTVCTNLATFKSRYTASGFSGSFYDYLKQELQEDMVLSSDQLQDLENRCATGCRYMDEPALMPAAFTVPVSQSHDPLYIDCAEMSALKTQFEAEYTGVSEGTSLYRVLFTNFCNHNLGYALSYDDYNEFTSKCSTNVAAVLYNKPASAGGEVNDFQCAMNGIMTAYEQAGQEYDLYIAQERQRFRNLYISKCLGTKASASVEGKLYEYHYTLYYYDQSGNLVKTIPPEGVRLLSDEQLAQVASVRESGLSTCENDGIDKEQDKTIVLNAFSSNLQISSAKSLELLLSNVDANAGSQVRFITPDNKYMYQAAIANKKLWVELYSLQPGTSGTIDMVLTNQAVADISSFTIQQWSQVVVQANNFASDPWDVYFNGTKLTQLPEASAPGYPFAWEIAAGYTLPTEDVTTLKHLRLYSNLLSTDDVYFNYTNPCLHIADDLQGTNTPLLMWGKFDNSSLCNPVTETATTANPGALQINDNLNFYETNLSNITNTFTVELWVNPHDPHEIDPETQTGVQGVNGQKYFIYPNFGGDASTGYAGMGISVGTNGVSVYEHASNYMPALLVWNGTITGWTHIAVVYNNKVPSLYINGRFVRTGLASTKQTVSPSYNFGYGGYGAIQGAIDEVRIWSVARTPQQILDNYQQGIVPSAVTGLVGYWPMDPDNGSVLTDISCTNNNNVQLNSGYSWITDGSNIAGVAISEETNNFLVPQHGMPTTYMYNSSNQVVKQTSPDGGTTRFWYDRLGKLSVSQNEEQLQPRVAGATSNRYSYTKYDAFDRIVEVGEKINAGSTMTEVAARDNASLQTWMQSGQNSQITQTIYDAAPGYAPGLLTNLRKRVAASIVLEGSVGSPRTAATYYSYDYIGNVKTLYQENSKLSEFDAVTGIKRIDYEYDLVSGKVNKVKYQEGKGDQFYYQYQYDADNRVVAASTSRDGLIWNTEATYRYYLHGPLARMELGQNKVQGVDYAYNLQGWIKGINSQQLDPGKDMSQDGFSGSGFPLVARDVLGFSLGYYKGDYQPIDNSAAAFGMTYLPSILPNTESGNELFNGNISHITLAINRLNNGAIKGYTYRYDQLNRLAKMRMHDLPAGSSTWDNSSIIPAYQEDISYDANGNIQTYQRNGDVNNGTAGYKMDALTYNYNRTPDGQLINNKLRHVEDGVDASYYTTDIDGQSTDYYKYDNIGNLITEGNEGISWNLYGKIRDITSTGQTIHYIYDATGNRIGKAVTAGGTTKYTFYVRDPQGNVLGIYTDENNALKWTEQHLYGSSRLGIWHPNIDVTSTWQAPGTGNGQINIGEREYELTNHLGNVLATISDSRTGFDDDGNGSTDHYEANVLTASDYYPFGMQMPGRIFNSGNYRYGFNGKENDNEVKGEGNQQDYGMRVYDPRIGKFLSVDPISKSYPMLTPYQFASNRPIDGVDQDGLEWAPTPEQVRDARFKKAMEAYNYLTNQKASQKQQAASSNLPPPTQNATFSQGGGSVPWAANDAIKLKKKYEHDKEMQRRADADPISYGGPGFGRGLVRDPFIQGSALMVCPECAVTFGGMEVYSGVQTRNYLEIGAGSINILSGGLAMYFRSLPELNVGNKVSIQKQARHLPGNEQGNLNVMESVEEAQSVVDALHAGKAKIVNFKDFGKAGGGVTQVDVEYKGITGTFYTRNLETGEMVAKPTNYFRVEGSGDKVKVFPINPAR
jgi:RHS repeat-associated protein